MLDRGAEEGAVAPRGTYLRLLNPGGRPCRVLYIVTPPYVFLRRRGTIVHDDAVVFGYDGER